MNEETQRMIDYIVREVIRRPVAHICEDTRLVSSGLIDSLALVNIILKLEDLTQLRIPAGKLQPKDLDTVKLMFQTAQRLGKPRRRPTIEP